MILQNTKNSLSLSYKKINDEGLLQTKSVVVNDLNIELADEDMYEIALLVKNIIAHAVEKITKKSEAIFLED